MAVRRATARQAIGHQRRPVEPAAGLRAWQAVAGNQAVAGLITTLPTGLVASNQALMRLLASSVHRDPVAATQTPKPDASEQRATVEKALVETATMLGLVNEDQATDQVFWLELR